MRMDVVETYLSEMERIVAQIDRDAVRSAVERLYAVWLRRATVYLIGNGGSASTASHMMNDLCKFTCIDGLPRFRAIALTDNVPLMTALGNDIAFEEIFAEPLRSMLESDDVLIAISGSGNSPNIVRAVEYARARGATVIGLCGSPGGKLAVMADIAIKIPSPRIGQQEDGHLILNHTIATALRERIAKSSPLELAV